MNKGRLQTALELEERQIAEKADRLFDDVREKSFQVRSQFTLAGHGPVSTPLWSALLRLEVERLDTLVHAAAAIRRENCETVPELGAPEQLAVWSQRLHNKLDGEFSTLHIRIGGLVGGGQYEQEVRKFILDRGESGTLSKLKAQVTRNAEMIAREVSLGMHAQPEPKLTVNFINFSGPAAAVNLGTIQGDMNTAIGSLVQQAGGEELAQGLKRLAEAVGAAKELGDERGEVLEGLAIVTQEAARPPGQRKTQLVRLLVDRWQPILMGTAALAEIWTAVHPLLKAWFGIP